MFLSRIFLQIEKIFYPLIFLSNEIAKLIFW